MSSENVSATVALLLTAQPDVADRDEGAAIVRASRMVQSWLDSLNVACARRTRELAAAGAAEPAESLLGDQGQTSPRLRRHATVRNGTRRRGDLRWARRRRCYGVDRAGR